MHITIEPSSWSGLEELRPVLKSFLSRHCRCRAEVDEAIQETFLRAARYRDRLTDPERLAPWTMRIALNVLADAARRRDPALVHQPEEDALELVASAEPDPAGEPDGAELRLGGWLIDRARMLDALGEALGALREEERAMLRAFYTAPSLCCEAAADYGIEPAKVKVRLYRARRRLVRALRRRISLDEMGGAWVPFEAARA